MNRKYSGYLDKVIKLFDPTSQYFTPFLKYPFSSILTHKMYKKLVVIIPAYNEAKTIEGVILSLRQNGFENVVVINDGSTDNTETSAKDAGTIVLSHPINIGLGGGLATGLEYARQRGYEYVITMDADGQHALSDVKEVAKELMKDGYDFVIGSRIQDMKKKYKARYYVNFLANGLTFLLCFRWVSDSQSGLRGFNRKAIEVIKPKTCGFEVSSEIVVEAVRNKLKIKEVPIKAIYTEYSLKKGQSITNARRVFTRLLLG